eukprot:2974456-Rhodomonas_salina.1
MVWEARASIHFTASGQVSEYKGERERVLREGLRPAPPPRAGARWDARGPEVQGVLGPGGLISAWVPRAYQNLEKMAAMFVGA